MLKYIIKFLLLVTFSMISLLGYYVFSATSLQENKILIIPQGVSKYKIGEILAQADIVHHPVLFAYIAKLYSLKAPIRSGEYLFEPGITPYEILLKLSAGRSLIHKMQLIEGDSVHGVLENIANESRLLGVIPSGIQEGQLLPDTYFYSYGDNKEALIIRMKQAMNAVLDEAFALLPKDSPLRTKDELLILASIVEKEAANDEERTLIASVFLNRLKIGMKLQADPTAVYALTQGRYKLGRVTTSEDVKIDSPYNTYKIIGLPPGAISCPGKKSIMAVALAPKSNFLYFVANERGDGHNFSSSLDMHNRYIKQLRLSQQQAKSQEAQK
jgi:UPF0755 protein